MNSSIIYYRCNVYHKQFSGMWFSICSASRYKICIFLGVHWTWGEGTSFMSATCLFSEAIVLWDACFMMGLLLKASPCHGSVNNLKMNVSCCLSSLSRSLPSLTFLTYILLLCLLFVCCDVSSLHVIEF